MLSESYLGTILTLLLAFCFANLLSRKLMDKWMPPVFAFVLWSDAVGRMFASNVAIYYGNFLMTFVGYAFLLGNIRLREFRDNAAWGAFIVFFIVFGIGCFRADYISPALKSWFIVFRMILCGFSVGCWLLRTPHGMERMLRWVTCFAFVGAILFIRHGNWNAADLADAGGRLVVDDENSGASLFNANAMALHVTALLPYPVLYLLGKWDYKHQKIGKIIACITACALSLVVLKTGSRNGGLVLLALGGYFLLAKTGMKKTYKIFLAVFLAVVFLFSISKFFGKTEVRSFEFFMEKNMSENVEDYGAGRVGFYMDVLKDMSANEIFVGSGAPVSINWISRMPSIANLHSTYIQILKQSGILGLFLLLIFFMVLFKCSFRNKKLRAIILLFAASWALTSIGEASNIVDVHGLLCYALGISIALCTRRAIFAPVFDEWSRGCGAWRNYR